MNPRESPPALRTQRLSSKSNDSRFPPLSCGSRDGSFTASSVRRSHQQDDLSRKSPIEGLSTRLDCLSTSDGSDSHIPSKEGEQTFPRSLVGHLTRLYCYDAEAVDAPFAAHNSSSSHPSFNNAAQTGSRQGNIPPTFCCCKI